MPLISKKKQKRYIRALDKIYAELSVAPDPDIQKELAFCIWNLLCRVHSSNDGVMDTINVLGVLDDVRLTFWQFKGSPLEDQAMFKRFNET